LIPYQIDFFYEVVKSILYKFNNSLYNTKFYYNIDRLIPYQIVFFSHRCVAFLFDRKKKVLEFIGIEIGLKLFRIYIGINIIFSWFVPFLFDRKKKVLEFTGIKIRWKLSKTKQRIDFSLCGLLSNFRMQSEHKKINNLMTYCFFIFGYKHIDIIYQIDFLVYHRCVPFFIWPKINRFWNLLLEYKSNWNFLE